MNLDNTRRKILKLAGASTVLGFANPVNASSGDDAPSQASSTWDSTTAILIRNNSASTEDVIVSISDMLLESDSSLVDQHRSTVEPGSHVTFDTGELDIGEGTYKVNVELVGQDEVESTTWKLSGGVPEWKRISAHVKPDSNLKLYNEEL